MTTQKQMNYFFPVVFPERLKFHIKKSKETVLLFKSKKKKEKKKKKRKCAKDVTGLKRCRQEKKSSLVFGQTSNWDCWNWVKHALYVPPLYCIIILILAKTDAMELEVNVCWAEEVQTRMRVNNFNNQLGCIHSPCWHFTQEKCSAAVLRALQNIIFTENIRHKLGSVTSIT